MRSFIPALLVACVAGRVVIGCSTPSTQSSPDGAVDGSVPTDAPVTNGDAASDAPKVDLDAPVPHPGDDAGVGYVRLAHVNQGLGPVDFCIGEGDFKNATPLLAAFASTGLATTQASRYVAASTRATALRLVTPGATNCATGIGADANLKVNDSSYTTVVAFGANTMDLALSVMADLAPSAAFQDGATDPLVRVVHAAVGVGTLNFGTGGILDGNFSADYPSLTFGKTAQPPKTDSLGYRRVGYWTVMSASAPAATSDTARWAAIEWGEPATGTLFLINDTQLDAQAQKVRALFCKRDSQAPQTGVANPSCVFLVRDP